MQKGLGTNLRAIEVHKMKSLILSFSNKSLSLYYDYYTNVLGTENVL